ncbi:hypothetical protein, partial [Salmonella enterica]
LFRSCHCLYNVQPDNVTLIVAIVGLRWVCTRTTSALPQGD